MKKYILGAVFAFGILVSPSFTQAAGLSTSQIQAILSILSSFGVDQSTTNNVRNALNGTISPPVPMPPARCPNGADNYPTCNVCPIGKSMVSYVCISTSSALSITTTSLPSGTVGTSYVAPLSATGGSAGSNYEWSASGLPEGLSIGGNMFACPTSQTGEVGLCQATGTIFGTPTTAGAYTVTVTVTSGAQHFSKQFNLVIATGGITPLCQNAPSCANAVNKGTDAKGCIIWECPAVIIECQNKWWFDSSTPSCSQKSFCGAYMYQGLQTFDSQSDCQAHLPVPVKNVVSCEAWKGSGYCSGFNSVVTAVSNLAGQSNAGYGLGNICCDGNWWIDVRGFNWVSSCNGITTGIKSGGWYTVGCTVPSTISAQTSSALDALASVITSDTAANHEWTHTWNKDLQIGSALPEDVSALQAVLVKEGVYTGEITGGFYNQTFAAVKKFQQKYGIKATGYVGQMTRAKLNTLY